MKKMKRKQKHACCCCCCCCCCCSCCCCCCWRRLLLHFQVQRRQWLEANRQHLNKGYGPAAPRGSNGGRQSWWHLLNCTCFQHLLQSLTARMSRDIIWSNGSRWRHLDGRPSPYPKPPWHLHWQCQASCASSTISTGVVCREDQEGKNVQPCPRDHNTRTMPCHSFGDILPNF